MKKADKWSKRLGELVKQRGSLKGEAKKKVQAQINAEYKRLGMNTKGKAKKTSKDSQWKAVKNKERTSSGKGLAQMGLDEERRKNPKKKVVAKAKSKTLNMKGVTIKSSPTKAKKAVAEKAKNKEMNMKGLTIKSSSKRAKKAVAKKSTVNMKGATIKSSPTRAKKAVAEKRLAEKTIKSNQPTLTIAMINDMVKKAKSGSSKAKISAKKKKIVKSKATIKNSHYSSGWGMNVIIKKKTKKELKKGGKKK